MMMMEEELQLESAGVDKHLGAFIDSMPTPFEVQLFYIEYSIPRKRHYTLTLQNVIINQPIKHAFHHFN